VTEELIVFVKRAIMLIKWFVVMTLRPMQAPVDLTEIFV